MKHDKHNNFWFQAFKIFYLLVDPKIFLHQILICPKK